METGILALLQTDIKKWEKTTRYLKEKYQDLSVEEQSAFDVLSEYWRNNDYNKEECRELVEILAKEAVKHGNMPDLKTNSQQFRELCKRYYIKDKKSFKTFQEAMGGKPRVNPASRQPVPEPVVQNARDGSYGRKDYNNGDYYIGELRNGMRNGYGKYFFTDGSWAEGEFIDDALTGHARRFDADSGRLESGEYENWSRVGRGRMEWESGSWQEGNWNDSGLHGEGINYVKEYNRTDRGQYVNGNRSGKGRMDWVDGEYYEGEWNENGANGYGVRYYPNLGGGATYKGYFVDGFPDGKGKIEWESGDWYDGDWVQGYRTGEGTYYDREKERFDIGTFEKGNRVGEGTMKWKSGSKYVGTWEDTENGLTGVGITYYNNGESEHGKYVNGEWIKATSFGDVWRGIGTVLLILGFVVWIGGALLVWVQTSFWLGLVYAFIGAFIFGAYYWVLKVLGLVKED